MAIDLKRSQLDAGKVRSTIERGYETVKAMNGGRNPSEKQREAIKKLVVDTAKKVDRDRGAR